MLTLMFVIITVLCRGSNVKDAMLLWRGEEELAGKSKLSLPNLNGLQRYA